MYVGTAAVNQARSVLHAKPLRSYASLAQWYENVGAGVVRGRQVYVLCEPSGVKCSARGVARGNASSAAARVQPGSVVSNVGRTRQGRVARQGSKGMAGKETPQTNRQRRQAGRQVGRKGRQQVEGWEQGWGTRSNHPTRMCVWVWGGKGVCVCVG